MLKQIVKALWQDARGAAAVELAIVAPVVLTIFAGVVNYGLIVYERDDLHAAARAGTQYFIAGGTDFDAAVAIVNDAYTGDPSVTAVSASRVCTCDGGGADCNTNCIDGSAPHSFAQITINTTLETLFGREQLSFTEQVRVR